MSNGLIFEILTENLGHIAEYFILFVAKFVAKMRFKVVVVASQDNLCRDRDHFLGDDIRLSVAKITFPVAKITL